MHRSQGFCRRVAIGAATIGVLALGLAATPASSGAASSGTLYFSLDNASELYILDLTDGTATLIGTTGVTSLTVGLTEGPDEGILIGSTWTDLTRINADGSGFELAGTDELQAEGLAYDAEADVLYRILNGEFTTADAVTGAPIDTLANAPEDLEGLAWRSVDSSIYGFGGDSSNLFRYDIATDDWTLVGDTEIPSADGAGLAWDPSADVFYGLGEGQQLYVIDPSTADAELIGATGIPTGESRGGGLAFVGEAPPVASLAAGQPVGEVGSTVTFPVSGTCGTDGSGAVSVSLTGPGGITAGPVDGTLADDGTWTASLVVPAAPAGTYTISGTCTLEAGVLQLPDATVVLSATEAPKPPSSETPAPTPVAANPSFTG
jgi:hypothetical protein